MKTLITISSLLLFTTISDVSAASILFPRFSAQAFQTEETSVPGLLQKLEERVGRDNVLEAWTELNGEDGNEDESLIFEGLSDTELLQLERDFEELGFRLVIHPQLLNLYGQFQKTLNPFAFQKLDLKLQPHPWWHRIKEFLHFKILQMAAKFEHRKI